MTKPFSEVRKEVAERMGNVPADAMPCRYCSVPTSREVLTRLGARCTGCYEQFLRLGYSGSEPPRQHRAAEWVRHAAKNVRHVPNQFSELAQRMRGRKAQAEAPKGLADDDVNALLREATP
jgi:hypothetical protein